MDRPKLPVSYVLPIAAPFSQARALSGYLHRLSRTVDELIVVDGSAHEVFEEHSKAWPLPMRHVRPSRQSTNGKVAGVMTGVEAARHDLVIVADDDVRYRRGEIERMLELLRDHEVVRPQNVFRPLPWHARWDTARSLLNRLTGGDWPGTLGVRRSALLAVGGYSGDVLFENLEMVRTIRAAGGREAVPLDLFVERRPPSAVHFRSQRIRQAYDEWARPERLAAQMAILPACLGLASMGPAAVLSGAAATVLAAEAGRRMSNGTVVYPASSALWAPAWVAERAITSWLAFGTRIFLGGVKYRDSRMTKAASSKAELASARTA